MASGNLQAFKNLLDNIDGAENKQADVYPVLRLLLDNPDVRGKVSQYCRDYGHIDFFQDSAGLRTITDWLEQKHLNTLNKNVNPPYFSIKGQSFTPNAPEILETLENIRDNFNRLAPAADSLPRINALYREFVLSNDKPDSPHFDAYQFWAQKVDAANRKNKRHVFNDFSKALSIPWIDADYADFFDVEANTIYRWRSQL